MRMTQDWNLTDQAMDFLQENSKKVPASFCPHCNGPIGEKLVMRDYEDASNTGMFDDGPMLHEYTLKDDRTAREIVQEVIWHSGPCIFLCLEIDGVKMYEWDKKDMENA